MFKHLNTLKFKLTAEDQILHVVDSMAKLKLTNRYLVFQEIRSEQQFSLEFAQKWERFLNSNPGTTIVLHHYRRSSPELSDEINHSTLVIRINDPFSYHF